MSAQAQDFLSVQDEIASFGELAFSTIRHQSQRIKELEAELERRERELDEALARIDSLRLDLAAS